MKSVLLDPFEVCECVSDPEIAFLVSFYSTNKMKLVVGNFRSIRTEYMTTIFSYLFKFLLYKAEKSCVCLTDTKNEFQNIFGVGVKALMILHLDSSGHYEDVINHSYLCRIKTFHGFAS